LAATTLPPADERKFAAIRARDANSFAALSGACLAAGLAAAWLDPRQPARTGRAEVVLWEGDVRRSHEHDELARLVREFQPAPTLVLLNFPRREDQRRALAAGAVELIAKPFFVADLIQRIHAALGSRRESTSSTPSLRETFGVRLNIEELQSEGHARS
jgi:DNA-binding NarL/FixJ family response regulator